MFRSSPLLSGHEGALEKEHRKDWGIPMKGHWSCWIEDEGTGELVTYKEFCSCYVGAHVWSECPSEPSAPPEPASRAPSRGGSSASEPPGVNPQTGSLKHAQDAEPCESNRPAPP